MTILPLQFGLAYPVIGTAEEREKARTAALTTARAQKVALEILPDTDSKTDLYFTAEDAKIFNDNKARIERFFAVRQNALRHALVVLDEDLKEGVAFAAEMADFGDIISAGERGSYTDAVQYIAAEKTLNPFMDMLVPMYGFKPSTQKKPMQARLVSHNTGRGNFNIKTGEITLLRMG